jgi:SAM-dependent methyltransferase
MNNKPFHAPVTTPKRILDIGCGTGVLTAWLARNHPNAEVIGVDISPVPTRHEQPENLNYVQGNIMKLAKSNDARFQAASFDYIFHRLLVFAVTDWPAYIAVVQSLLAPGGWAEMQDLDLNVLDGNGDSLSDSWWFYHRFHEDCKAIGLDMHVGSKLAAYMADAGSFTNANETVYQLPFQIADVQDAEVRKRSMEENMASNRALVNRVSGARRSKEDVEKMLENMEVEFHKLGPGDHSRMFVVVGQKV